MRINQSLPQGSNRNVDCNLRLKTGRIFLVQHMTAEDISKLEISEQNHPAIQDRIMELANQPNISPEDAGILLTAAPTLNTESISSAVSIMSAQQLNFLYALADRREDIKKRMQNLANEPGLHITEARDLLWMNEEQEGVGVTNAFENAINHHEDHIGTILELPQEVVNRQHITQIFGDT